MKPLLRTITDQVTETMREGVLSSAIPADEPLRQDALAAGKSINCRPVT